MLLYILSHWDGVYTGKLRLGCERACTICIKIKNILHTTEATDEIHVLCVLATGKRAVVKYLLSY